jgi:hypothetical protein
MTAALIAPFSIAVFGLVVLPDVLFALHDFDLS